MSRRLLALLLVAALGAGAVVLSRPRDDGFPHERHAGLFPTCVGCHAGVESGDSARMVSISPADCAGCHDGEELEAVEWEGPTPEPTNLAFSHPEHAAELAGRQAAPLECAACHRIPGAEERMAVALPVAETCVG